jgi:hypothetical protein
MRQCAPAQFSYSITIKLIHNRVEKRFSENNGPNEPQNGGRVLRKLYSAWAVFTEQLLVVCAKLSATLISHIVC